jgi:hypothetical protein
VTQCCAVVHSLDTFFTLCALSLIGFGMRWPLTFDGYQETNADMMKVMVGVVPQDRNHDQAGYPIPLSRQDL